MAYPVRTFAAVPPVEVVPLPPVFKVSRVAGVTVKLDAFEMRPPGLETATLAVPAYRAKFARDWTLWAAASLLVVTLCVPWFVYAYVRFGRDLWDIMLASHVYQRFTSYLDPNHLHPWNYYFVSMFWNLIASQSAIVVVGGLALLTVQTVRRRSADNPSVRRARAWRSPAPSHQSYATPRGTMPQGIVEHWHRPKKFRQQRTRILQFPTDMHGENLQIGRATRSRHPLATLLLNSRLSIETMTLSIRTSPDVLPALGLKKPCDSLYLVVPRASSPNNIWYALLRHRRLRVHRFEPRSRTGRPWPSGEGAAALGKRIARTERRRVRRHQW